jgi:hypothetical protein
MNAQSTVRTRPCTAEQGRVRFKHARKFLDVAQLVSDDAGDAEYASAGTALAVLAGIAASDAACCRALGRRPRSQDHHQAADLLAEITPGGLEAAKALRRLLSLKDEAHYGLADVGGQDFRAAIRQATALVAFAEAVLSR